jgi:hypothetical protein
MKKKYLMPSLSNPGERNFVPIVGYLAGVAAVSAVGGFAAAKAAKLAAKDFLEFADNKLKPVII